MRILICRQVVIMILCFSILMFVLITSLDATGIHRPLKNEPREIISETLIRELVARIEILETRDAVNQNENRQMKNEIAGLKKEMAWLRKENTAQKRLLARLLRRQNQNGATKKQEETTDTDNEKPQSEQAAFVPKNRIRRANEESVMFSVGLTHSLLHLGEDQNIPFDHVEINKGNGYNPNHGAFVAPVAGVYVFHSSILANNNREVYCSIVVNGQHKATVYARGTDGRLDQGSQEILVHIQAGDAVSVQNLNADDAVYGDGNIYSTFSGFLLEQDYSQASTIVG